MNRLGSAGIPFLFIIDYEGRTPLVLTLPEAERLGLGFRFTGSPFILPNDGKRDREPPAAHRFPVPQELWRERFDRVREHLRKGDSWLVNLTFPTRLETEADTADLFRSLEAPYSLHIPGRFACFSPERFVRFEEFRILTSPMKGTADAAQPGSRKRLLENPKEQAEHITVVDLLRNDLSAVAADVMVTRYRYCRKYRAGNRFLWQTSSDIEGRLPADWREEIGTLLFSLLPAGSITGAPKKRTMEIIDGAEITPRGFYTGVFGWFDGEVLDSAVIIRYAEMPTDGSSGLIYRSGGGITLESDPDDEYRELLEKIYVPLP